MAAEENRRGKRKRVAGSEADPTDDTTRLPTAQRAPGEDAPMPDAAPPVVDREPPQSAEAYIYPVSQGMPSLSARILMSTIAEHGAAELSLKQEFFWCGNAQLDGRGETSFFSASVRPCAKYPQYCILLTEDLPPFVFAEKLPPVYPNTPSTLMLQYTVLSSLDPTVNGLAELQFNGKMLNDANPTASRYYTNTARTKLVIDIYNGAIELELRNVQHPFHLDQRWNQWLVMRACTVLPMERVEPFFMFVG